MVRVQEHEVFRTILSSLKKQSFNLYKRYAKTNLLGSRYSISSLKKVFQFIECFQMVTVKANQAHVADGEVANTAYAADGKVANTVGDKVAGKRLIV